MIKKEVVFKSEYEDAPEVLSPSDVDFEKDLGAPTIEKLPEIKTEDQFEVTTKKKVEQVRERVALIFIIGFFMMIAMAIVVGAIIDKEKIKDVTDLILAVAGVLSGSLGFIIGYYFKSREEESAN